MVYKHQWHRHYQHNHWSKDAKVGRHLPRIATPAKSWGHTGISASIYIGKVTDNSTQGHTKPVRLRKRHMITATPRSDFEHRQDICSRHQHDPDCRGAKNTKRPPGTALPSHNCHGQQSIHPRDLCMAGTNGQAAHNREKRSRTSRWPSDTGDDRRQDPWRPRNGLNHIGKLRLCQQHTRKCKCACSNHRSNE